MRRPSATGRCSRPVSAAWPGGQVLPGDIVSCRSDDKYGRRQRRLTADVGPISARQEPTLCAGSVSNTFDSGQGECLTSDASMTAKQSSR